MDAVQLFVQSPCAWRFPEHDPADLEAFRAQREELGIQAVTVHALYLLNLASPKDDFYEKSVTTLRSTMDAACAIEADAVVFHVGSHLGSGFEAGLERMVPALLQCLERCSETTWLCMENAAGTGDTVGRSLKELAAIYEAAGRHERLGVCLDSCHLFASGYDVTDRKVLDGLLSDLEERPARQHRRRPDGREARRLRRPPEAAEVARAARSPGHRRPRAGRRSNDEATRAARESYEAIRAKIRNEGSPTGSSWNSGLTHPSSSLRLS